MPLRRTIGGQYVLALNTAESELLVAEPARPAGFAELTVHVLSIADWSLLRNITLPAEIT